MNLLTKLAGQTAIYGLSSVVGRLLNYLLVPLYTRYFLPAEYGIVTEMYAYAAFFAILLTYGIETSFFRFTQSHHNKEQVYSTSLISLIFTTIIFLLIIFFFSNPIAQVLQYPNNPEYIQWFAIILSIDVICSITFAKLREMNKAFKFALIRLINIFINISLNIFFIIYCPYAIENNLGSSFVSLVYSENIGVGYIFISNLISSIFTAILLLPQMLKSTWVFDKDLWKKMIIYGLPLLIAGLAGMINEVIDRILLKQLLLENSNKMAEIGLYGAFYKLSILMTLFIQTFRFAAESFFFANQGKENYKKIYADVMNFFVIITSVIFLTVTLFYDKIILFLGENYHDPRGFEVVSVLLAANLFLGIYYNLSIWYKLSDQTKYGAYLSIFGAIITITLNLTLIPIYGFVGCAWATLICYLSMTIASYLLGKKHYMIRYNIRRIFIYLGLVSILYFISIYYNSIMINLLYIIIFVSLAFYIEKTNRMTTN